MGTLEGYVQGMIDLSGGGGGSSVDITPVLTSGTKIADYTIDGDEGSLYAPTPEEYSAGDNININENNVISASDTKYTAGNGISISENNVISATGGSADASVVYILNIRCIGLAGYTVTLTYADNNSETHNVITNDENVKFEIMNAGVYILSNSKNNTTLTYTINVESGLYVPSVTSIIPVLTGNTGSNGIAIAPSSDPNYGNGDAYKAFNDSFADWLEYLGEDQSGAYVGYIFTNSVYIDSLIAYMGNYDAGNDYLVKLQLTYDGTTWIDENEFHVAGYSSGNYGTFNHNVKKIVKGFRYYSTQQKSGGNNWYTYEIACLGYDFN